MMYIKRMRRFLRIFGFLWVAALILASSLASPAQAEDRLVQIKLIPETTAPRPGQEIWVAIEQTITSGWHTYWKNPGDSGVPPRIQWTLPPGFAVGDVVWPAPHRLPYGPLLNYGYGNRAVLLQKLKTSANRPAAPITLKVAIDVLVCKDECIPESGTYDLTLNDGSPVSHKDVIQKAQSQAPKTVAWDVEAKEEGRDLVLNFKDAHFSLKPGAGVEFYPHEWGLIENTAQAKAETKDGFITIRQKRGDRPFADIVDKGGLLVVEQSGARQAYAFASNGMTPAQATKISKASFWTALICALLGGMILNLMPCVFPVLSMKALSLAEMPAHGRAHIRMHGLSYTAGVVGSFVALAGVLIALKAGGAQIGWGFQLQNPAIVMALAYLFFLLGLNLLGYFEWPGGRFANIGGRLAAGRGYSASFFTGALAALVATPCTAPFMATALGYALIQPAVISLTVFAALGFGLALPYLAICFIPAVHSLIPRPGAWMEAFRQFLAFPLFATASWMVWILVQQIGPFGVFQALLGAMLIAYLLWAGQKRPRHRLARTLRIVTMAMAAIIIAFYFWGATRHMAMPEFGAGFSQEKLDAALAKNDPVFVEVSAAWCITCKFNHAAAIDISSTRAAFAKNHTVYLMADWTNYDAGITSYLKGFGRSGVPLYVYYPARAGGQRPDAVVLPQILTPGLVLQTISP